METISNFIKRVVISVFVVGTFVFQVHNFYVSQKIGSDIEAIKENSDEMIAIHLHTNRMLIGLYSSTHTAMEIERYIIEREDLIKMSHNDRK